MSDERLNLHFAFIVDFHLSHSLILSSTLWVEWLLMPIENYIQFNSQMYWNSMIFPHFHFHFLWSLFMNFFSVFPLFFYLREMKKVFKKKHLIGNNLKEKVFHSSFYDVMRKTRNKKLCLYEKDKTNVFASIFLSLRNVFFVFLFHLQILSI